MPGKIYYLEQTKNAVSNFGKGFPSRDIIRAFAEVKLSCIEAIQEYNKKFPKDVYEAILIAINDIIKGNHDDQFVIPLKQGGAGTSFNMNFNEVIASISEEIIKNKTGKKINIDPIEDINLFQSTNDVFPTAITIMLYRHLLKTEKSVIRLQERLITKENEYNNILMTGRTEMQSALPITLGQVFGAWAGCIERDRWRIHKLKERIRTIALGGTAIGTCFFAPQEYIFIAEKKLQKNTGLPLCRSQNLPDEISNTDKLSELASGYSICAQNLFKITGDLLIYTSSMLGEIKHPALQYGSSIMAAKTNPVILEYVQGLSIDIQGECYKIIQYCQNGKLQLNVFLPFIVEAFINIYSSLIPAINTLVDKFFNAMSINKSIIEKNLVESFALLNALLPMLGYNKIKNLYEIIEKQKPSSIKELKSIIKKNTDLDINTIESCLDPTNATTYLK